jgi:hypothetical protein
MRVTHVGFTGHRNRVAELPQLDWIRQQYLGAVWVHGGAATGFDAQVAGYIRLWELPFEVVRPDYARFRHSPKLAPLKRNEVIVARVQVLVACWDGREKGGTFYTINCGRRARLKQHHLGSFDPVWTATSATGMSQETEPVWVGTGTRNTQMEFLPGPEER